MGRYISGFIALAAAFGVYQYNQTHETQKIFLLGLNLVFGDDPDVLAARTWQILAGVGVLWLFIDVMNGLRKRGRKDDAAESDAD